MNKDKIWCSDCKCFVEDNHRCQQWETTSRIPKEAIESALKESQAEIERLKCCGNCKHNGNSIPYCQPCKNKSNWEEK